MNTIYLDDNAMIKDNKFYVLKYDSKQGTILTPADCIVYYDIVKNIVIDTINKDGLTSINKKTYDQVRLENENVVIMDIDRACKMIDDKNKTKPKEIDYQQFEDMLCALPPENWIQKENSESFIFSEYYSGTITDIYARINEKYYTFRDSSKLTHNQIINKIKGIK